MTETPRVTLAEGDGIGPEITRAVVRILEAAGAQVTFEPIEVGEAVFRRGIDSGIPPEAWAVIRRNPVMLKGPITTPQGGGYKSLNVTLRKALGLFANVRQCTAYAPFVTSAQPGMDLVIVRENEEDLYAGIEYRQTQEVTQALKLITRPGSAAIIRYAFEYARAQGRRQVTCMTKDNIMKVCDGLFHKVFDEIATEYPDLEAEHQIIDIGAARVAARPERMDVIVTLNLYGDILSDIAAEVAGSVGLAGSANIGERFAMFEAIHGSAPDIAGQDLANPSGLLLAAVEMLVQLGQTESAARIKNAWLATLEAGVHTGDVYRDATSRQRVGTQGFADAVIARLGQTPQQLPAASFRGGHIHAGRAAAAPQAKALAGIDVFLDWNESGRDPNLLGQRLEAIAGPEFHLKMISNRGAKVYPDGIPETYCSDHWRCRFLATATNAAEFDHVLALLARIHSAGLEVIKTEHLYTFDGLRAYSLGQGE